MISEKRLACPVDAASYDDRQCRSISVIATYAAYDVLDGYENAVGMRA